MNKLVQPVLVNTAIYKSVLFANNAEVLHIEPEGLSLPYVGYIHAHVCTYAQYLIWHALIELIGDSGDASKYTTHCL